MSDTPERPPEENFTIPMDRSASASTPFHGRFVPGTPLGKRWRIVSLLGSGGMGEVYRADDLELGQPVALKFLPPATTGQEAALARLRQEVRIARQVSHPNVCRVYDLNEVEGLHFLSMEYVDGEDMASVLRRMGRPTEEKALAMARQLCAGLAAAHELGVLHRDLKPANIMLDGRGRVRIMDFGLAGFAEELKGESAVAGTLAYMAPEQLEGKEVSTQSDVYSLGLVLYELFTGKRAYEVGAGTDLRKLHESGPPSSPSELIKEIDPLVERAVLRCLERNPGRRLASAFEVAAALPGGDPLQVAIAAGETPSPEMVAAAGGRGGLRPGIGWSLLAAFFIGLLAVSIAARRTFLIHLAPPKHSPAVFTHEARNVLERLGDRERLANAAWELELNGPFLAHVAASDSLPDRWERSRNARPGPHRFWYRESKSSLSPDRRWTSRTRSDQPAMDQHGMLLVVLDSGGRLLEYRRVDRDASGSLPREVPDWGVFYTLAALDPSSFDATPMEQTPQLPGDEWRAWKGPNPDLPTDSLRVEAGSVRGRPTYFRVLASFESASVKEPMGAAAEDAGKNHPTGSAVEWITALGVLLLVLAVVVLLLSMAHRNLRRGRGDRHGALYTGLAGFILALLHNGFGTGSWNPAVVAGEGLSLAFLFGGCVGLAYLAFEPAFRRSWPDMLVSWTRLLAGRLRDPLVGRDILIGLVGGVVITILDLSGPILDRRIGIPMAEPMTYGSAVYRTGLAGLADVFDVEFLETAFLGAGFILLALLLFRRRWIAALAAPLLLTVVILSVEIVLTQRPAPFVAATSCLIAPFLFLLAYRFGFLSVLAACLVSDRLTDYPVLLNTSEWYAGRCWIVTSLLVFLALWALRIATVRPSHRQTARP